MHSWACIYIAVYIYLVPCWVDSCWYRAIDCRPSMTLQYILSHYIGCVTVYMTQNCSIPFNNIVTKEKVSYTLYRPSGKPILLSHRPISHTCVLYIVCTILSIIWQVNITTNITWANITYLCPIHCMHHPLYHLASQHYYKYHTGQYHIHVSLYIVCTILFTIWQVNIDTNIT